MRFGEIAIECGFVTEEQVNEALAAQRKSGRPVGEVLLELGHMNEDQLLEVLAKITGYSPIHRPSASAYAEERGMPETTK